MIELKNVVLGLEKQSKIIQTIVLDIKYILDSRLCFLWLLDRKTNRYYIAHSSGISNSIQNKNVFLEADNINDFEEFCNGELVFTSNNDNDTASYFDLPDLVKNIEWESRVSIPLVHEGKAIAILDSYSEKPKGLIYKNNNKM